MEKSVVLKAIPLVVILIVIALVFDTCQVPKTNQVERDLHNEFELISPLPQSTQYRFESEKKIGQVMVIAYYNTTLGFEEVNKYYNTELTRKGWISDKEERLAEWGKDYGGKEVSYRKGQYVATLSNSGKTTSFTFDLSWSLIQKK